MNNENSIRISKDLLQGDPNTYKVVENVETRDIPKVSKSKKNHNEKFLIEVSAFSGIRVENAVKELDGAFIEAFIDEAYIAVTGKWKHLKDAPLEFFITTPKVSNMFAHLVALCLRTSRTTSGNQYELDKIYMRINLEKKKVMNYFRSIEYTSPTLFDYPLLSLDDLKTP